MQKNYVPSTGNSQHKSLRWQCTWKVLEQVPGVAGVSCVRGREDGRKSGHEEPTEPCLLGRCENFAFYLRCNGNLGCILLGKGMLKILEKKMIERYDMSCCFTSVVF